MLKGAKGGSPKNSAMGAVFAAAFYESFTGFGEWVLKEYLDLLGAEEIPDCHKFVSYIISNVADSKVQSICGASQGYSSLLAPCLGSSATK